MNKHRNELPSVYSCSINDFIQSQDCASLCYVDKSGKPHCFNCYYVFDAEERLLCFKSSPSSKHSILMEKGSAVAGTILSADLRQVFPKQGLQFEGEVFAISDSPIYRLSERYYECYPMAKEMPGAIWLIKLNTIILSNSTEIFGEKLYWNKN